MDLSRTSLDWELAVPGSFTDFCLERMLNHIPLRDSRWPQHAFMLGQMLLIYDRKSRWYEEPTPFPSEVTELQKSMTCLDTLESPLYLFLIIILFKQMGKMGLTFSLHFFLLLWNIPWSMWVISHLNTHWTKVILKQSINSRFKEKFIKPE